MEHRAARLLLALLKIAQKKAFKGGISMLHQGLEHQDVTVCDEVLPTFLIG